MNIRQMECAVTWIEEHGIRGNGDSNLLYNIVHVYLPEYLARQKPPRTSQGDWEGYEAAKRRGWKLRTRITKMRAP